MGPNIHRSSVAMSVRYSGRLDLYGPEYKDCFWAPRYEKRALEHPHIGSQNSEFFNFSYLKIVLLEAVTRELIYKLVVFLCKCDHLCIQYRLSHVWFLFGRKEDIPKIPIVAQIKQETFHMGYSFVWWYLIENDLNSIDWIYCCVVFGVNQLFCLNSTQFKIVKNKFLWFSI